MSGERGGQYMTSRRRHDSISSIPVSRSVISVYDTTSCICFLQLSPDADTGRTDRE